MLGMKRKEDDKQPMAKFCPKCGSTRIKMTTSPGKVYFGALSHYHCMDCGYEGIMLEGDVNFISDYKDRLKGEKNEQ